MPTTYAHDLFGKKIYKALPPEMKKVIRTHGELYRIGLHGPDILFYFFITVNPVTRFGVKMHKEKARAFFEQGMAQVRETGDEALLAYLLGFGCHYLLDSTCHPYVNEAVEKQIVTHTLFEKEFDRLLMRTTGKNEYSFYPSDCIVADMEYARVIHRALPLMPAWVILASMKMMKFFTNLMVCDDGGRRRNVLSKIASFAGESKGRFVRDHFMEKMPATGLTPILSKLMQLYHEAVAEAPDELAKLYALSKQEGSLTERWDKTYNG